MRTVVTGENASLYRRIAVSIVVLTVGLITLGGVVRITGAGMGCGDHWPLCNGRLLPNPADILEVIEWSHRWVASLLSTAVLALAIVAWRKHRHNPYLRNPALLALAVLVLQVLLGAVTVKLGTSAPAVVIHLTNAMVLLAVVVVCLLRADESMGVEGPRHALAPTLPKTILITAILGFVTILAGAFVANYDAGVYCLGFPLCAGELAPPHTVLGRVQWVHRLLALLFLGSTAISFAWSQKLPREQFAKVRLAAGYLILATVAQILVAAAMILQ